MQKATLRYHVEQFLAAPESYDSIRQKGAKVISNHGHCCSDIMNALRTLQRIILIFLCPF